jgi:FixJ family two-component response regulator
LIATIDDDDSFRTALVESLYSFGYGAHGFASAEEFLGAGELGPYDCIITDIHMPGMSGIELQRLLAGRGCRIPVILVTARAEPGLEASVTASGAVCLLRKPFEAEALTGWLDKALAGDGRADCGAPE